MAVNTISNIHYGSTSYILSLPLGRCGTAASNANKTVTIDGAVSLENGLQIVVWFSYTNTATLVTLNVNDTGAKPIYSGPIQVGGGDGRADNIVARTPYLLIYYGDRWLIVGAIPVATETNSGIITASDKIKLNSINQIDLTGASGTLTAEELELAKKPLTRIVKSDIDVSFVNTGTDDNYIYYESTAYNSANAISQYEIKVNVTTGEWNYLTTTVKPTTIYRHDIRIIANIAQSDTMSTEAVGNCVLYFTLYLPSSINISSYGALVARLKVAKTYLICPNASINIGATSYTSPTQSISPIAAIRQSTVNDINYLQIWYTNLDGVQTAVLFGAADVRTMTDTRTAM